MTDPVLWQLTPDRVGEWREIRLEALADSPLAFGATLAEWADRPQADFAAAGCGRDLGGWRPSRHATGGGGLATGLDPGTEDMGWITAVYTRPSARGRGLMAALLRHLAARAASAGMVRLGLHVGIDNGAGRQVYRRSGFHEIGAPFLNDRGIAEIEMQRPLA